MKKVIFLLLAFLLHSVYLFSCTTFVLKNGENLVFGRNLDWVSDNGVVVVNKRNVQKTSLVFPPDQPIQWTSKYGSVTFNQFGAEFPFGGINEKGLVIEIMLADADYPEYDSRPAVNELQWIQFMLDNSKTIDEVIQNDKKLRISKIEQNLHFLICDATGNVAVLEFKNNELLVYKGDNLPIPVLENDVYSESLEKYKKQKKCRFSTATKMINNFQTSKSKSIVDYSFEILDEVALSGSWSVVYDIKNLEIHFKTASNKSLRKIDMKKFNFDCDEVSVIFDLKSKHEGKINTAFIPFNQALNENKMKDAVMTNGIYLPEAILLQFYGYHKNINCHN